MVLSEVSWIVLFAALLGLYYVYYQYKIINGTANICSISGLFLTKYIIFFFLGTALFNIYCNEYYLNLGFYRRPDLLLTMFLYGLAGLVLIPTGMLLATSVMPKYNTLRRNFYANETVRIPHNSDNRLFLFIGILFLLCFGVLLLYVNQLDQVPIVTSISNENADSNYLAKLRSDAGNGFSGKYYRYNLFFNIIPLSLIILMYLEKRKNIQMQVFSWILIIYQIFILVMNLEKGPLLNLIILMLLVKYYKDPISVRYSKYIKYGVLGFIAIIIMYMSFMGVKDIDEAMEAPFQRAILGSCAPFFYYLEYIEQNDYYYGATLPNPGGILPFEHRNFTIEIMNYAVPKIEQSGVVGTMPTVFFGEWYLNYGSVIAMASMVVFGFVIQLLDIYFTSYITKYPSLYISAIYVYLINYISQYSITALSGVVIDEKWIVPILLLLFMKSRIEKSKRRIIT